MEELSNLLKQKLQEMRDLKKDWTTFDYYEIAQMYQLVCFMKQIKFIVNCGDINK